MEAWLEPKPPVQCFTIWPDTRKVAVTAQASPTGAKTAPSFLTESSLRREGLNVSLRSVTRSGKAASMSASMDRGSVTSRRKSSTANSRDSRFMMLPHVDVKAGDDLMVDLRGHRVQNLSAVNLSPTLENSV